MTNSPFQIQRDIDSIIDLFVSFSFSFLYFQNIYFGVYIFIVSITKSDFFCLSILILEVHNCNKCFKRYGDQNKYFENIEPNKKKTVFKVK